MLLQECLIFGNFVLETTEKTQIPGCLMNVVKMLDGRRKREEFPSHHQVSISLFFTSSLLPTS